MKLDANLASVHAYLCADGYVIKNPKDQKFNYYHIGFRNTNEVLLKDFQIKFEKIFGIKPHLVLGERCRIGSKQIYEKLTNSFGSFYSWHWKMPEMDENLSKLWLKSYYDCDGWVTCKSHKNRHIGLDSVNEHGLIQIKNSLEKLGIKSKIKKRNDRNIFSLMIFGKDNLVNFSKNIGFLHPDKNNKLNESINDFINYYWNFPTEKDKLVNFIRKLIFNKGRINKSNRIFRLISNKEDNLINLKNELNKLFNIECKINKRKNGIGTIYFELNINRREELKKLIDNNLLNKEQRKWLNLKK